MTSLCMNPLEEAGSEMRLVTADSILVTCNKVTRDLVKLIGAEISPDN